MAEDQGYRRIYGIGGAGIYTEMLPMADRLLVTEVDVSVSDPDTYFPEIVAADWKVAGTVSLRSEEPVCLAYEYIRRFAAGS